MEDWTIRAGSEETFDLLAMMIWDNVTVPEKVKPSMVQAALPMACIASSMLIWFFE